MSFCRITSRLQSWARGECAESEFSCQGRFFFNNFLFVVFQRAEFPRAVAGQAVPGSAEGGSNWSRWLLERATKQTWHWQGWGMLQIPAVSPQRRRGFLDEPPFVLNFPLFQLNKATILPVLTTTAFWKCKITRSH